MGKKTSQYQCGFSIIELMIVVAIIAILATIALPNYNRMQNRSRQSEAKAALSAIYSAEQSFRSEWSSFYGDFRDIGYAPELSYNYVVGFAARGPGVPPGGNFTATVTAGGQAADLCFHNNLNGCGTNLATNAANVINPSRFATGAYAAGTAPAAVGTVAACGFTVTSAAPSVNAFAAGAYALLPGANANDVWGINEQKVTCNLAPNF